MAQVMMTLQCSGPAPTLEQVKSEYNLQDDEIDPGFGIVSIDPSDGTYALRVEESAATKLQSHGASSPHERQTGQANVSRNVQGPYSDPFIQPFDLPTGRS